MYEFSPPSKIFGTQNTDLPFFMPKIPKVETEATEKSLKTGVPFTLQLEQEAIFYLLPVASVVNNLFLTAYT